MANFYDFEPSKSYANAKNAHQAVDKLAAAEGLKYIVVIYAGTKPEATKHFGRYVVVFIGANAMHMAHLGFNVIA